MVFLLLVLGMVLLMKGADLFVDGSASVARKLKVPSVMKLRFQILWVLIFSIRWLWLELVQ